MGTDCDAKAEERWKVSREGMGIRDPASSRMWGPSQGGTRNPGRAIYSATDAGCLATRTLWLTSRKRAHRSQGNELLGCNVGEFRLSPRRADHVVWIEFALLRFPSQ